MVASSLASLTEPAFDEDVVADPRDGRHFQRQRLTEILGRHPADCVDRVPAAQDLGRQEKNQPVHDPSRRAEAFTSAPPSIKSDAIPRRPKTFKRLRHKMRPCRACSTTT